MSTRIICKRFEHKQITEAFNLGGYDANNSEIVSAKYSLYEREGQYLIEFDDNIDFCQLLFLMVDLNEVGRMTDCKIKGFVNTDVNNKITEYLGGERICFYVSENLKAIIANDQNEDNDLDIMDLVTRSGLNYSIDIDNLFSYESDDETPYIEPIIKFKDFNLIETGTYLFEESNFEQEFLEDIERANENG